MSKVDRAISEANRAVNEAVRDSYAARSFKLVRFGRHRDGYLHAQTTFNGAPVYVHLKHGSWLIPSVPQADNCPVRFARNATLKEVVAPYKYALAKEARKYRDAERKHEEARNPSRPDNHGAASAAGAGSAVAEAA